MKALFDTNILIDFLNGEKHAKAEITRYKTKLISIITQMEVLFGVEPNSEEETIVQAFLQQFIVVNLDEHISNICIRIKRQRKIRLPDAIIWASAEQEEALFATCNTQDFPGTEPFIRIPYQL